MYSISLCRTWSIIKLKRPKKDGVRCHLTKKSNEIINNNLFSVKFKKEKQKKERWSGLSFDEKIKSFIIYNYLFSIHRRRIYDVHRILSTSKIQRVSKTFGTYIQICAQFTKDEERDDPGLDKYHIVASSNTSHLKAHPSIFRLLMKGIFDALCTVTFQQLFFFVKRSQLTVHKHQNSPL